MRSFVFSRKNLKETKILEIFLQFSYTILKNSFSERFFTLTPEKIVKTVHFWRNKTVILKIFSNFENSQENYSKLSRFFLICKHPKKNCSISQDDFPKMKKFSRIKNVWKIPEEKNRYFLRSFVSYCNLSRNFLLYKLPEKKCIYSQDNFPKIENLLRSLNVWKIPEEKRHYFLRSFVC